MQKFNAEKTRNLGKINKLLKLFFHEENMREQEIIWSNVRKILIVDMTLIGDTVMLIPFLRALKKSARRAEIDLICGSWGQAILDGQGLVDKYYFLPGSKLESPKIVFQNWHEITMTLKAVRKTDYDVLIEPRGDLRYIFFMYFCKGKRKISYNYTGGETMLTDCITPNRNIQHLIDDKLYLLKKIGCGEDFERQPDIKYTEPMLRFGVQFTETNHTSGKMVVGIHPGASLENKRWDGYPQLISRLGKYKEKIFIIIFEGPGEERIAQKVCDIAEKNGFSYLRSCTGLWEYIYTLSACDVVVCNDSSAGHIAAALGKYVVSVMGPFPPEYAAPVSSKVFPVSRNFSCKPCISRECKKGTNECIRAIPIDDVIKKLEMILARIEGEKRC